MPLPISVKLPSDTGAQLRTLSAALGLTVTETIANLLILGADHHRVPLPIEGVSIVAKADGIHVSIDDFAFQLMTPQQTRSLAKHIEAVIDRSQHIIDLDLPDFLEVHRMGGGIALTVTRDRRQELRRVFSRGAARILAHHLTTVAAHAAING